MANHKTNKYEFTIGARRVGDTEPAFIIAEAGINHNGSVETAKKLIDAAVAAGADAVKFQMRHLDDLYTKEAVTDTKSADIGTQYLLRLIRSAELRPKDFDEIVRYARERNIIFLCTPFDKKSADVLQTYGVSAYKVASADLTNFDLLEYLAKKKKPLIVSTGMSSLDEIKKSVAFLNRLGATYALLHCNSAYPSHPKDLNLRFIPELKKIAGGRVVGYSGHELGLATTLATVPLGAKIIERHLTLDRTMTGPDHAVSLEPEEFKQLVRDIRRIEQALTSDEKNVTSGEYINRKNLGKSLVATGPIKQGQLITKAMVTAKSPAKGLSPQDLYALVGKKARRDMQPDDYFTEEDLGKKRVGKTVFPKGRWGIITRPHDVTELVSGTKPHIIELHFSSHDIEAGFTLPDFPQAELVVHLPELYGDDLLDLCSLDETVRQRSIAHANRGLELVRKIRNHFGGTPKDVKTVVHVGGMSYGDFVSLDDRKRMYEVLAQSLTKLNLNGIDIQLENLPPFPWYKGGQWFSNTFMDADEMAEFAKRYGYRLCYDSSHAQLYCNYAKLDPVAFFKTLMPHVGHIHLSDGAGTDSEGLQIGEGNVPWKKLVPLVKKLKVGFMPEIWMGHRNHGEGFWVALKRLNGLGL